MSPFRFCLLLRFLFAGWLLCCSEASALDNGRIVMVTEATFPPYEFREGDEIVGIDPSIMREVSRATGRELIIEDMSFDSVITAVVTGKADVAASGITVTPERMQQVDFSIPYVEASQVIIVPKDSPVTGKDQEDWCSARCDGRYFCDPQYPATGAVSERRSGRCRFGGGEGRCRCHRPGSCTDVLETTSRPSYPVGTVDIGILCHRRKERESSASGTN